MRLIILIAICVGAMFGSEVWNIDRYLTVKNNTNRDFYDMIIKTPSVENWKFILEDNKKVTLVIGGQTKVLNFIHNVESVDTKSQDGKTVKHFTYSHITDNNGHTIKVSFHNDNKLVIMHGENNIYFVKK